MPHIDAPTHDPAAPSRLGGRTWTGWRHALGPALVMFAGPTMIDVCAAIRPAPTVADWLEEGTTVASTLAGVAWLIVLAIRHPGKDGRWWEIATYAFAAVVSCWAVASGNMFYDLDRTIIAIMLVIRLAGVRGQLLAPGEPWRHQWAWSSICRWASAAGVMAAGIAASAICAAVIPDWVGVAPTGGTTPSDIATVADWLGVIISGPVEETVAMAGVVAGLEWARRPAWQIYGVVIAVRVAFHIHLGIPTALSVAALAAASAFAFRRWRMITPLAITHTAYDALVTILAI